MIRANTKGCSSDRWIGKDTNKIKKIDDKICINVWEYRQSLNPACDISQQISHIH